MGVSARLREQHIEVLRVVRDLQRAHDGDQHESSWPNTQSDMCDVPMNDQTKAQRASPAGMACVLVAEAVVVAAG